MIPRIEPPRMDVKEGTSTREQTEQLRKYLFKLAEDINYALGEIERKLENIKEE